VREEVEDLGVEGGVLHPEGLSPDLMELPKPARLGALVAEHRADVIDLTEAPLGDKPVLEVGPDHGSRALRAQGETLVSPVLEGVHLLVDDVGPLSDRTKSSVRSNMGVRISW